MQELKKILGIVGPKGGVGKSTISANLAIALAELGRKVICVDLDFGAANLNAIFGIRKVENTLDDFLLKKVKQLTDVLLDTDIKGLKVICGGDAPGIANMPYQRKIKLIRHLSRLGSDVVLLDLSAGVSFNVVDFLMITRQALLVTTPDIPSLMNVYSFIKSAAYRRLTVLFRQKKCPELLELLEKAKDVESHPNLRTMEDFLLEARKIDPEMAEYGKRVLSSFKPYLVINRVQTTADTKTGRVIDNLMHQYLSMKSKGTMVIREDAALKAAAAKMRPVIIESPSSKFSLDLKRMALNLQR